MPSSISAGSRKRSAKRGGGAKAAKKSRTARPKSHKVGGARKKSHRKLK